MKTNIKKEVAVANEADSLLGYIDEYLPEVAGMERPLNTKQTGELIKRYGYDAVKTQLEKMENFRNLNKYRSAYLTCMKWFEMDIQKGWFTPPEPQNPKPNTQNPADMVEAFLTKHPVGSEIALKNGNILIVEDEVFLRSKINNGVVTIADFIKKQRSHQK